MGDRLIITATDPGFATDVGVWCERTGHVLDDLSTQKGLYTAIITKGEPHKSSRSEIVDNDKTMVIFSGDLDKAIASMIIANGAVSMGRQVTLFFTFWGLNILRKHHKVDVKKNLIERMFGMMMPRGSRRLGLSRMNMGGMGSKMIRDIMKSKNISSLEELIESGMKNGIKMVACQMTMDVMGLKPEELIDGVEIGGVATMLGSSERSDATFFI